MAKTTKKKETKQRADHYEEKVKFEGKFIDMVKMSVKDAENKVKANEKEKD